MPTAADLKPLPRGDGSISWDEARQKLTLRHIVDGHAYTERGDTRADVIAKRNRRRRDLADRAGLVEQGEGTIAAMLTEWVAFESQGKSAQTVRHYQWSRGHLVAHFGDRATAELDVADIETFFAAMIDRGFTRASLAKLRSHLKLALEFGVRRKYLPAAASNLLRTAKMPAGAARRARAKLWFTLTEYDVVRQHLMMDRGPRAAMFLTMLLTGLRPAEAAGLRWEHVDLPRRVMHVEGAIQRQAAGAVNAYAYTTTLKTDHHGGDQAHREIPIPTDLRLVLTDLQSRADGDYVFSEFGTFLCHQAVRDTAHHIATDAGVRYVNPNGYRHTFASICRHNGMPYEQLAKLMGHKDASMIIETYGHPIVAVAPIDLDRYLGSPER